MLHFENADIVVFQGPARSQAYIRNYWGSGSESRAHEHSLNSDPVNKYVIFLEDITKWIDH